MGNSFYQRKQWLRPHLKTAHMQEQNTGLGNYNELDSHPDNVCLHDAEIYETVDFAVASHQMFSSVNVLCFSRYHNNDQNF